MLKHSQGGATTERFGRYLVGNKGLRRAQKSYEITPKRYNLLQIIPVELTTLDQPAI
jgi:hypothetical protein